MGTAGQDGSERGERKGSPTAWPAIPAGWLVRVGVEVGEREEDKLLLGKL
jgi:hypothetical protein